VTTRLDIYSDVVCPWCYLGAANLLRALGEHGGRHPFAIGWRPFQLDPTIPPEGMDRAAYLAAKFGDGGRIALAHARLTQMGADSGIDFHFDRIARAPNTLDAHRVIRWAEPEGLQTRTAMALFFRYFEQGEDVSDPAVLRAAAEDAGLDGAAIARLLAGDADRDAVAAEVEEASRIGITGVPTFILGGRYAISGAQPTETWTRLVGDIEAAAVGSVPPPADAGPG
jgi:predicted DsbA family dithiol-disulfide isomerase